MRVGIDVSILSSPLTGIGRFTLSLVEALARTEPNVEWVLLGAPEHWSGGRKTEILPPRWSRCQNDNTRAQNDSGGVGLPEAPNVTPHYLQGPNRVRRVAWQQVALPRLARRYGLDVLHCPDCSRPVFSPAPVVNTLHDLAYYSPDAFVALAARTYKRKLTHIAVRKSAHIAVDSKFTRDELAQRFGLDGKTISVIYLGVDQDSLTRDGGTRAPLSGDHRSPLPESGDDISPLQNGTPFVLYVGTLEKRKNLLNLIEGFTLMRARNSMSHRLVLAGKPGRGFDQIQAAIRTSAHARDIEVLGYVDGARVLDLYRSADAVAMPSLYEGFGLPVLEAMALGAPVVCSRAASLPEVGGDSVEYFNPLSPHAIGTALAKVLASEDLRSEMRRKGLERAKLFTWDECARRYCAVYREAAGG